MLRKTSDEIKKSLVFAKQMNNAWQGIRRLVLEKIHRI